MGFKLQRRSLLLGAAEASPAKLEDPSRKKLLLLKRRRRAGAAEEDAQVDMSPLIDCVFLLLIFFLVTSMMKRYEKQIPVTLPDSTSSMAQEAVRETLVIGMDESGKIFETFHRHDALRYRPLRKTTLAEYLVGIAEERGQETPIRLDADRNVPFQQIVDALDVCQIQGFKNVGVRIRQVGREYHLLNKGMQTP